MRDLDQNPYTADEARVAKFFCDRGVGGGDDPIGAMMIGYAYLVEERNELRAKVNRRSGFARIDAFTTPPAA